MSRHPARPGRLRITPRPVITLTAAAALLAAALTGCAPSSPEPAPSAPSASPTPTTPSGPTLEPDGDAADNLPLFAAVTASVWGTEERESGRAYVDALIAAGFDRAAMQVTPDQTTVGNPADSIQFSVRWGDECLVGQVGPATGEPVTAVVPALAEGTCLVGETRPIDW